MATIVGVARFDGSVDSRDWAERLSYEITSLSPSSASAAGAIFSVTGACLIAENESVLLAADGRWDNRVEAISELGLDPRADDAQVLLAAWRRWKSATFNHLMGDFAVAVLEKHSRSLTLARDASGQRPLFFRVGKGGTAFASLAHALRIIGPSAPDLRTLADKLIDFSPPFAPSIFHGIETVAPGEVVTFSKSTLGRHFWWQPGTSDLRNSGKSVDSTEEYRAALDEAVRSRVTSPDRPVATYLSSGFDSGAVTATAARLFGRARVMAFTSAPHPDFNDIVPRGRIADESGAASLIAARYGIHHEVIRTVPPLINFLREHTNQTHEPIIPAFNVNWLVEIRRKAAAAGAKVLLCGEMGNLSLNAGGLPSLSSYLESGNFSGWAREALACAARPDVSFKGVLANSFGPWIPRRLMNILTRRFLGWPEPGTATFLRQEWLDPERLSRILDARPTTYTEARLATMRRLDPGVRRKFSKLENDVDESDPTADQRLMEFSLRLAPEQLLRNGQSRPLAKAALADRLPRTILDSKVRGLQSADWTMHFGEKDAREALEEIRSCDAVNELLDLPRIEESIGRWPKGRQTRQKFIASSAITWYRHSQ